MYQNFKFKKENKKVKFKSTIDILKIADTLKPKNKMSALKLREKFERNYERA